MGLVLDYYRVLLVLLFVLVSARSLNSSRSTSTDEFLSNLSSVLYSGISSTFNSSLIKDEYWYEFMFYLAGSLELEMEFEFACLSRLFLPIEFI